MFQEGKVKSYNTERGFGFIQRAGETQGLFFHIRDVPKPEIEPMKGELFKFIIVEDQGRFKAANIIRLDLAGQPSFTDNEFIQSTMISEQALILPEHSQPYIPKEKTKKNLIFIVFGFILLLVFGGLIYGKYQTYLDQKQIKTQQLMIEQKKIIEEQKRALGDLPEQVLSEQGKQNLNLASSTSDQTVENITSGTVKSTDHEMTNSAFKCDGRTHCSQMHSYEEAVFFLNHCPNTKMDGNGDGIPCERQFGH